MNEVYILTSNEPRKSKGVKQSVRSFALDAPNTDAGFHNLVFESVVRENRQDFRAETMLIDEFGESADISLGATADQVIGEHEYATWLHLDVTRNLRR